MKVASQLLTLPIERLRTAIVFYNMRMGLKNLIIVLDYTYIELLFYLINMQGTYCITN